MCVFTQKRERVSQKRKKKQGVKKENVNIFLMFVYICFAQIVVLALHYYFSICVNLFRCKNILIKSFCSHYFCVMA